MVPTASCGRSLWRLLAIVCLVYAFALQGMLSASANARAPAVDALGHIALCLTSGGDAADGQDSPAAACDHCVMACCAAVALIAPAAVGFDWIAYSAAPPPLVGHLTDRPATPPGWRGRSASRAPPEA